MSESRESIMANFDLARRVSFTSIEDRGKLTLLVGHESELVRDAAKKRMKQITMLVQGIEGERLVDKIDALYALNKQYIESDECNVDKLFENLEGW